MVVPPVRAVTGRPSSRAGLPARSRPVVGRRGGGANGREPAGQRYEADVALEPDRDLAGLVLDLPLLEERVRPLARLPFRHGVEARAVGGVPGTVEPAAVLPRPRLHR